MCLWECLLNESRWRQRVGMTANPRDQFNRGIGITEPLFAFACASLSSPCSAYRHRVRMHIKKLKVRKARGVFYYHYRTISERVLTQSLILAGYQTPCAAETVAMLSCWATSKDIHNTSACAASAQALADCMRSSVSGALIFWRQHHVAHAFFVSCVL